jgi:hypothetical protein
MNPVHAPYEAEYVRSHYKSRDSDGRQYQLVRITAPGGASKGNAFYELLGYKAYYVYKEETGKRMAAEGRIVAPSPGSIPRLKMYLDEPTRLLIKHFFDTYKLLEKGKFVKTGNYVGKEAAYKEIKSSIVKK